MSFILLLFIILPISFHAYEFENLEQLTSYNLVFSKGKGDHKIFKYSPICEGQNTNLTNIYAQGVSSLPFYLAIYDDDSQIKFTEEEGFINDISNYSLKTNTTEIKDLSCDKDYYFVVYTMDYTISFSQFSILPGEVDIIDISSLADSLTVFQRSDKKEILFYSSKETKNISISIFDYGALKIVESDELENKTIIDMDVGLYYDLFQFEKDKNYYIYYSSEMKIEGDKYPIILQLFNDVIKHNFNNGPIIFTGKNVEYNYEIDITNYKKRDYLVLIYFGNDNDLSIKYRYKNSKSEHFTELKKYEGNSFIPLQIMEKDSSIILNLKITYNYDKLLSIGLFEYNYEDITSEYNNIVKEPKLFRINSYLFNNLNAIGIQSNKSYYLNELEVGEDSLKTYYGKVSIITQDYEGISFPDYDKQKNIKDIFIFINADKNNYSSLEIKKFNFPIYHLSSNSSSKNYFQLCNKKDDKDELYFYSSDNFFRPIFGDLSISLTYFNDINSLADLTFNESIEDNFLFKSPAYLKISCDNPVMFTNIRYIQTKNKNYTYNLKSSEKIYLSQFEIDNNNYTLDKALVNEVIQLRFNIFGLTNNQSIKVNLDGNKYELNNTKSLEIEYNYKKYAEDLIKFDVDDDIKNNILIEIIVASLKKDLESYQFINFTNSMEPLNIQSGKGVIIKITKDFNENLFNYFIVFPNNTLAQVEISYDKLEYIVPRKKISVDKLYNNHYELVSLFKNNPYSMISENENSDNEFFYILIYNEDSETNISFKKPYIISDIAFNKLNIIPELQDKKNSFYKINIPSGDYKSLIFQIISNHNSSNPMKISISHDKIEQPYVFYNDYYYSLPTSKSNPSLNIYNSDNNNYYINVAKSQEFILKENKSYELNAEINQVNNTNKLKITLNSLSYYYSPLKYKYYLIINSNDDTILDIASIISGHRKLDTLKNQTIITIEEDSKNIKKVFEKEVDIKMKLNNDSNTMIIVPAIQENNLLDFYSREKCDFNFSYIEEDNNGDNNNEENNNNSEGEGGKSYLLYVIIGVIIVLIIIIIIIIFIIKRKQKKQSIDNIEKKVLNAELNSIQEE